MKVAVKYLITLVLALLLVWAVHTYVLTIFSVPQGGLPPYLKSGSRVIVNRVYCDSFKRGDLVVFTDTIARRGASVTEAHFIGRIERLPGDTITLDKVRYVIPAICCRRCGCPDCRFYLVRTQRGPQIVHKHQMIGKAHLIFK